MKNVTVYTINPCPYCSRAKALLAAKGIEYKEILIDRNDDKAVTELKNRTGWKTFPQIFEGDKLIGGYAELATHLGA